MNEKGIIAYCGLYCSECSSYTGIIADLSRDLRKAIREHRFEKTAEALAALSFFKDFKKFDDCYKVLGAMVKLRCRKGCRDGGGNPFCAIRKCCLKKGFEGCWECDEFKDCKKMDFLKTNHGDAYIKNLRKIKSKGKEEFLKGKKFWYSKIKS